MADVGDWVYVVTHPGDTDATVFAKREDAEAYAAMFKDAVWDEAVVQDAEWIQEALADV